MTGLQMQLSVAYEAPKWQRCGIPEGFSHFADFVRRVSR